jgi:hypothetical protein
LVETCDDGSSRVACYVRKLGRAFLYLSIYLSTPIRRGSAHKIWLRRHLWPRGRRRRWQGSCCRAQGHADHYPEARATHTYLIPSLSTPADNSPFALGSVDGHALQIDELKGTKPTEKIDLSNKRLGVASAIIIASCIKENGVLKEL